MAELNSVYAPRRDLYNSQINNLDPQMQAEEKGLEAQKQDSFNQITTGANRRGLLFSGIPLAEQAQYTGQSFLPAVANLKAKYAQHRFNLQDALAKINQEQQKDAYGIYDAELTREAAERAAAAARAGSSGGGGYNSGTGDSQTTATTANTGSNWQGSLQQYLAAKYASSPGADRATQDSWVKNWASVNGLDPRTSEIWAYYDSLYPWAQYSKPSATGTWAAQAIQQSVPNQNNINSFLPRR